MFHANALPLDRLLLVAGLLVAAAVPASLTVVHAEQDPGLAAKENAADGDATPSQGVAVVELFTSEGCSSCPPAERVLNTIAKQADESGAPIFPLAFHVDYWNRLGWRDRFSSPDCSARQRTYARAMKLRSLYTPQMVVNGKRQFVGSDSLRAKAEIEKALAEPVAAKVTLFAEQIKNQSTVSARWSIAMAQPREGLVLNLAIVESGLQTRVKAGENQGRDLAHENVVRAWRQVQVRATQFQLSGAHLTPPAGLAPPKAAIIAYVQDPKTMAILGAAKVDWPVAKHSNAAAKQANPN